MTTGTDPTWSPSWTAEKRRGYAPVNGLEMYYEIHGTGRPTVHIHPAWGIAKHFPALAKDRQMIAVELQGHGHTADIGRPLSFEQHADVAAALLEYLGIEQADLFGESFGGIVTTALAIRHPGLVRRVANYATPYGSFGNAYQPALLGEFIGVSADSLSVQYQRENYSKMAADPAQWSTLFDKVHQMQWNGFSHEELKSIAAPVLIAVGDHDWVRAEHSLEAFRLIPKAQFAVIPDAGHFVFNVEPERVLPTIAAFLDAPEKKEPFATPKSGYHPGATR